MVKNPPANAGASVSIPSCPQGSGRSPGKGNGYPLQCSFLRNRRDRGVRRAAVHWVIKGSDRTSRVNNLLCKSKSVFACWMPFIPWGELQLPSSWRHQLFTPGCACMPFATWLSESLVKREGICLPRGFCVGMLLPLAGGMRQGKRRAARSGCLGSCCASACPVCSASCPEDTSAAPGAWCAGVEQSTPSPAAQTSWLPDVWASPTPVSRAPSHPVCTKQMCIVSSTEV